WDRCPDWGSDPSLDAVFVHSDSAMFRLLPERLHCWYEHRHRPKYECKNPRGADSPCCPADHESRTRRGDQMLQSFDWRFDVPIFRAQISRMRREPIENNGPTRPRAEQIRGPRPAPWEMVHPLAYANTYAHPKPAGVFSEMPHARE